MNDNTHCLKTRTQALCDCTERQVVDSKFVRASTLDLGFHEEKSTGEFHLSQPVHCNLLLYTISCPALVYADVVQSLFSHDSRQPVNLIAN